MSPEVWREVVGFPDYAVSFDGQVKRMMPDRRGRLSDRPLRQAINTSGYLTCTLFHPEKKPRPYLLNRIVCEAFHGAPPSPEHHAAHCDGVRTNNRADNLRWATPRENEMDKRRHGTLPVGDRHHARLKPEIMPRGSRSGRAKLTEESVRAIRADGRVAREIAQEHGVTRALIQMVKANKVWRHV